MSYSDTFSFYRSPEWRRFRALFLSERMARDGELICEHCGKVILRPYDAILHHKIELDEANVQDASIALNPENIMLVCHRSHNQLHDRWCGSRPSGTRHIYVVWGSPCSGKRKYVEESAGKHDLIIDIDALYDALGVDGERSAVKQNVLGAYRALIDMVRTRNGRWRSAWILRTLPLSIDRESIVREIGGGELIHIDTAKEECMSTALERGGDWPKWVEEYWTRYQSPE